MSLLLRCSCQYILHADRLVCKQFPTRWKSSRKRGTSNLIFPSTFKFCSLKKKQSYKQYVSKNKKKTWLSSSALILNGKHSKLTIPWCRISVIVPRSQAPWGQPWLISMTWDANCVSFKKSLRRVWSFAKQTAVTVSRQNNSLSFPMFVAFKLVSKTPAVVWKCDMRKWRP